jgi:endonuclease/exonuclease/phosphatase family metal-dependent hydrolase
MFSDLLDREIVPIFSLVTVNILNDLSLWKERGPLLVKQLAELDADLIAMQEVSLQGDSSNAHWVADQLNNIREYPEKVPPYEVLLCPRTGVYEQKEGLAILSRFQVRNHECLDLLTQNRVAQVACFRIENNNLLLLNGHLYWQTGESSKRQNQIELLLDFLDTQPVDQPVIVCGDFNGVPGTPAIERMRQYFDSAHNAIHKSEPEYTCPTPLPTPPKRKLRNVAGWVLGMRPKPDSEWRGTLDYIFVDPRLQTQDCHVVLNSPETDNPEIYASDHFGLWASIKVTE